MAAPAAMAQAFTRADSGWVPLFDGKTFDGFYSRMQGGEVTDTPDQAFSIDSGMIKVIQGPGWKQGYLGTRKTYSHYRMRVEYRFTGAGGQAGIAYHVDESVPPVPRIQEGRPRSLACGLTPGDAGRAYGISGATFTTRAAGGRFHPDGALVVVCEDTAGGCDARDSRPSAAFDEPGRWNKLEVVGRGSDSALHVVNDSTVMRLWDLRAPSDSNPAAFAPFGRGSLALSAEGAGIALRNWEIMELPTDGPSSLQRLFLSNTDGEERLTPGGTHVIAWRTLGEVPKVSLFWHAGDGQWEMMADNITNTGSFAWTVPAVTTQALRVKVTAAPWVLADSSAGDNTIGPGAGVVRGAGPGRKARVELRGGRDVQGRAITAKNCSSCRKSAF